MAISVMGVDELARAYRDGSCSPSDAVEASLAAIEELDGKIGAWQAVYADEAREVAAAATRAFEAGQELGPFHGIPFALKDIVDLAGRITTAGCAEWRDRVPAESATIARRLLAAGGVLVGKTKTVEFAMGGWGTNEHMGTPHNPWDAEVHRTPGGSSCGSGASVGSGMVPCAVGTDTGGSVRLPAAFCGIAGLKTTEGQLPTDGIVPLSHTLDTPGPMARSVADLAVMYEAMGDVGPAGATSAWGSGGALYGELERGVRGLQLAALGPRERDGVDADQLDLYDAALDVLASAGASIVPFDPPQPFDGMKTDTFVIVTAEGFHHHGAIMSDPTSQVDRHVRARFEPGAHLSAADYVAAGQRRAADRDAFAEAFRPFDALLTPTTPMLPLPVNGIDEASTPARFTRAGNWLALCGTAVPTGLHSSGLPGSLQVLCRGGDEALSLRIAAAYESARGPMPNPPLWPSVG